MKFTRPRPQGDLVNLTPLIDMVFILLVFFMMAGAIRPTDVFPVDLAKSASRAYGDERDLIILVRADGMVAVNNRAMRDPDMIQLIRERLKADQAALVQVKADGAADANRVITIMESLREAGVGYIVLLTKGAGLEQAS